MVRALLPAIAACFLVGCLQPERLDIAPHVPDIEATMPTDNGRPILRVAQGTLPDLQGQHYRLSPGVTTFLVRHADDGQTHGEFAPQTALWLRGRGEARHLLPSYGSRPLRVATMEDWSVDLVPGTYDLSVSLGTAPTPGPPVVLVVR